MKIPILQFNFIKHFALFNFSVPISIDRTIKVESGRDGILNLQSQLNPKAIDSSKNFPELSVRQINHDKNRKRKNNK